MKSKKPNRRRKSLREENAPAKDLADVTLRIEQMAFGGKGVARSEGKVYFVVDTVPGDVVRGVVMREKERYAEVDAQELLTESSLRGPAACPYAKPCGGCQWQGIPYETQLEWKKNFVVSSLGRIGKLGKLPPIEMHGSPAQLGFRNRILLRAHYSSQNKILQVGYFRRFSRELVPISACAVGETPINSFLDAVTHHAWTLAEDEKFRIEIQSLEGALPGKVSVVLHPSERTNPAQTMRLKYFLDTFRQLNMVAWAGSVFEARDIHAPFLEFDHHDGMTYFTQPGIFQQVNVKHNHHMRNVVREATYDFAKHKNILDLFCGSGNLSLQFVRDCRYVHGIEFSKQAIATAHHNITANKLSKDHARFESGDAGKMLADLARSGAQFDVILADPPREGMHECISALKTIGAGRIVYVSCDPTTLARDIGLLTRGGSGASYALKHVQCFDLFPQTFHVETVAILDRI